MSNIDKKSKINKTNKKDFNQNNDKISIGNPIIHSSEFRCFLDSKIALNILPTFSINQLNNK